MRRSALVNVPSFSRNDVPGQQDVRELAGLVEEQVLHDDEIHRRERRVDVVDVRVGLGDVLAMHEDRAERAVERGVEHVRDPQPRLGLEGPAPQRLVERRDGVVGDVPVAGQLVGERAHVARALHVVLAAQRVDADAFVADVAGGHREVGHAHDHGRALAVLGDAEAVVDRGVATRRVQPRGGAHVVRPGRR